MIIGIFGYAGAGKDTAADALPFTKIAFADPLRTACAALFNLKMPVPPDEKTIPGPVGVSYRRAMQVMGTDVVRDQFSSLFPELSHEGKDHWVELLFKRINPDENYVITDVRFLNEAAAVVQNGGLLVYIKRGPSSDSHPSETGIDTILMSDLLFTTVDNIGTIEDLQRTMRAVVEPQIL